MSMTRPILFFGLPFFVALAAFPGAASAQSGAPFSSQNNALGGRFSAGAMGRPLGGISTPVRGPGNGRRDVRPAVVPYGYSWYVPNYFDNWSYPTPSTVAVYDATTPYVLPPAPLYAPAQPPAAPASVVINQYFNGVPAGSAPQATGQQSGETHAAGEPLVPVENYYLIAYKDHSVYSVMAYWLEDKTLHYVTTHNIHNQASLDLIDLNLTKTLNQARDVPFALPANAPSN